LCDKIEYIEINKTYCTLLLGCPSYCYLGNMI